MKSIALTQELLNHFQISEYYQANPGGQKTVFIVTIDNKKFALKIINVADERFEREVKICKEFALNNGIPNIERVEIFGSNTIILEQYIDGNDLSEILPEFLNNEQKIREILTKVVKILIPIWEARYVHRDLKPQNIRIKSNSEPVVLDFGIARVLNDDSITATGGQPLSWLFATPEQYSGKKDLISYKTDFFCLGIIAFNLFTGRLPFGNTREEIEQTFMKNISEINSGNEFINNFSNEVFKINPSERPRKINSILNLLEK